MSNPTPAEIREIRQKHAWTHGREDPDCRPSQWACIAVRLADEVERLKEDIGRRMISASGDRRAAAARVTVLREMLLDVEVWMRCDIGEHGPGPSGGYLERLRRVREALARTEAGEPKG